VRRIIVFLREKKLVKLYRRRGRRLRPFRPVRRGKNPVADRRLGYERDSI